MPVTRVLFLIFMLVPCVAFAQPLTVTGEIPYAPTPPVLDGVADDAVWEAATEYGDYENVAEVGALTGPDDLTAIWKGLWDSENLYFHVTVVDDVIIQVEDEGGDWNNDSVEFYVDPLLEGLFADALGEETLDYGGLEGSEVKQLTILVGQETLHEGVNHGVYLENGGPGSEELNGAWVVDGAVYSYEVAFPWEALGADIGEVLGQGTIGFASAINDRDDEDGRDAQIQWLHNENTLWNDVTEFQLVELLPPDEGPNCDFDGSGVCDIVDLDELLYTGLGTNDAKYDLDGSGTVDLGDRDAFLNEIGSFPGDFDLDGKVVAGDLNILGGNWQNTGLTSYAQGDSNGDGVANAQDLNDLGSNWQAGVTAAAAVPEPIGLALILAGILGLLAVRRKKP